MDRLLMTLASECMQPDRQPSAYSLPLSHQDSNNLLFLSQHWAVAHLDCIRRMIVLCKELVKLPETFDEKLVGTNFRRRLSFCLRILKLLGSLVKDIPYVEYDSFLLQAVAWFADVSPGLFRLGFEFANNHTSAEGSFESIVLLVLEEFLHLVQLIFCNSNVFQNIQACIVASILDNLDSSIWRYNNSAANPRVPLAFFPRTVLYILKLMQDFKKQSYQTVNFKELDKELTSACADTLNDSPSCVIHQEKVPLLKKFTVEELLSMVFPSSKQWVDNLMHLTFFLHSEGAKLRVKVERSHSSCSKVSCSTELDNTLCHEDEALFGNLFSEGSRSIGSLDGYDQPVAAVSSSSSNCNLPMQAAMELLSFLKLCVFSHEWQPSVFEDACRKLNESHIDILLSLLNSQGCFEVKTCDSSAATHEEGKTGQIHELSFELLQNLFTCRALSGPLEEYLIERILNVENGMFIYNDRSLTLLAHTLLGRVGLAGCQLRTKIYQGFVHFIVEKANMVHSKSPGLKELLGTLPSALHMEILLIAFYLSSEGEKATLANLVFSSIRGFDIPSEGFYGTQLSCWAILVSRLIVLLRHMTYYPQNCPPTLLRDLRSRLREGSSCASHVPTNANDHLSSWASIAVKSIMGSWVEEEPTITILVNQLIDFVALPTSLSWNEPAIDSLCLSWGDMRETFSRILGLWKGRKALAVEELIVERYIFVLCCDIPSRGSALDCQLGTLRESLSLDTSNLGYFFHINHSYLRQRNATGKDCNFADIVVAVLQRLNDVCIPENIEELGWDFLRNGSWLSLVLSWLSVGIWGYSKKNKVPGVDLLWTENTSRDADYVTVSEGLISCLVEAGQVEMLMRILSSLLSRYLQCYQKAFLATLNNCQNDADRFISLLLLKHSGLDKGLRDELLEKSGTSSCQLESIFLLLLKLEEVDNRALGILSKVFWECMLHGFPSHLQTPSGVFLSCVLSIRGIILVLDGLSRVENLLVNVCLETELLHEILDSVMSIKFDKIFESLHNKCEAIFCNLSAGLELTYYSGLHLMKNMEGFLRDTSSQQVSDSNILEWVITKTIDTMDALRKDPQKSLLFKYYLGAEEVSQQLKEFHGLQRGDMLALIDALDNCCSESVNQKVLNFFVDILSGDLSIFLKQKVQKKFLGMDLLLLSKWLEKRLLGCKLEPSDGVNFTKGNSVSLRESTMSFVLGLVSSSDELLTRELHNHLFEAVLVSLETVFTLFDIHIAKSYFHFVVQLSRGENSMKLLLKKIVTLMDQLVGDERLLPALKFLFGFLGTVLGDCGSSKSTPEKSSGKSLSSNSLMLGPVASRSVGSCKNSDTLVLCGNQEGGSSPLECDATSVDEDEDDGTSDGEVASIDKDEEDDPNSERALASKVCTFTSSGSNFMEQHWYFCYTCDLTVSKGCCSVCAKVCHRGHRVVYSRSSRFFCDCGAGGVRGSNCQCLKPRKYTGSDSAPAHGTSNFPPFLPFTDDADQLPESDSDLDEDVSTETENSLRLSITRELQDAMPNLLEELDFEQRVLELCSSLLPSITSRRESNVSKDKRIILGKDKVLSSSVDLLQLKRAYKSGSLDLKIKADYSNARELKSHLASGSLVKSLLSVSIRGRLAVGEGDKVAIFDAGQLIGQATIAPVTSEKSNAKPLSRNVVRFEIVHLSFNILVENYLAVAGYEDCQVLTLNHRGEVTDRLAIELALQGAYIRRIDWVPGSPVQLMVVTNRFVKIYDLSQDNISPMYYFTCPDDLIVDATVVVASRGRMFLIVLSECGSLYRLELSVEVNVGATPLKETIHVQDTEIPAKGLSLYFSSAYKVLFLSYQDGTTFVGRLNQNATSLTEISGIYEEQDGKQRPAGLHHWKELLAGSGLFFSLSSLKSNAALAVSMGSDELLAQNMRHAVNSTSPLVGITAYKPLSKDKVHCLVLHDDGSLQIYSHVPMGVDAATSVTAEKVKKLGANILNNKAYASTKPEFPLDFFEKTVCITTDVKLSGDAIRNGDSEGAKQSLASEDGFLESPSPTGFKVFVVLGSNFCFSFIF